MAYVSIPNPKSNKPARRAYECVFIGYASNSKAYKFFDLKDCTIIESNDVDFYEYKFPFKLKNNGSTTSSNVSLIKISELEEVIEIEPRRSKHARITKDFRPDFYAYTVEEDPNTLQEVLSSIDANLWQEAIKDEMESLESNRTWHFVDLPPSCKWILKKKLKLDDTIEKYKARLVAKGFRQRENVDFFDIFSIVTRITSIRVLFSLAAIHDLVVHQMDVKTTFLNGELEEDIYIDRPKGFVINGQENKVCKLDKSLYGSK